MISVSSAQAWILPIRVPAVPRTTRPKEEPMPVSALRRSARRFSLPVHVGLTLALLLTASRSAAQPLGTWDPPRNLGFRVVHGMLLPDDRILTWAYSAGAGGTTATHEIDPDTGRVED